MRIASSGSGWALVTEPAEFRVVEVADERSELARRALELIVECIGDVQPLEDLLSELEERRLGLPSGGNYHLLALLAPDDDRPMAAAAGVYLQGVNAGFVTYLAVRSDQRARRLGRELRAHLVEAFRADAERLRGTDLAWTVGEVRRKSAWLRTLVQEGRAIPLDLRYLHPWMPRSAERAYVLYREPVGNARSCQRRKLGGSSMPSGNVRTESASRCRVTPFATCSGSSKDGKPWVRTRTSSNLLSQADQDSVRFVRVPSRPIHT